ncbi:hypothetical protein HDV01_002149 [Terramyces sp. JEL0728]|nr:hypothetical protein HDV01_002149 [Terramyces sp. JEL0728]
MASRPPSRPASRLSLGREVEVEKGETVIVLSNGLTGTVRFKGTTNFATGNWIGIELDEPAGKNDGSVMDTRYFECQSGHGIFVRPSQIQIAPKKAVRSPPTSAKPNSPANQSNSNGHLDSVEYLKESPAVSKMKLPMKLIVPNEVRASFDIHPKSPVLPSKSLLLHNIESVKVPSIDEQSQKASLFQSTSKLPSPIKKRSSISLGDVSSVSGDVPMRRNSGSTEIPLNHPVIPNANIPQEFTTFVDTSHDSLIIERARSVTSNADQVNSESPVIREIEAKSLNADSNVLDSETQFDDKSLQQKYDSLVKTLDEMQIKCNSLLENEKRSQIYQQDLELRLADAELREKQVIQESRDLKLRLEVEAIHEKERAHEIQSMQEMLQQQSGKDGVQIAYNMLQAKCEGMKVEIANIKGRLEKATVNEESSQMELAKYRLELDKKNDELELCLLDKCLAEERSEELHTQNTLLNDRVEELTIELDLANENITVLTEDGNDTGGIKNQNQLSLQNERLSLALIKLREITTAKEVELKEELESSKLQSKLYVEMNETYVQMQKNLGVAQERIHYLKSQLNDNDSAAEIVQTLTDQNLKLDEALVNKKLDLMELEQLRFINNELEMAHVDLERQLYDECDVKEQIIKELIIRYQKQKMQLLETGNMVEQLRSDTANGIEAPVLNNSNVVELAETKRKLGLAESELQKYKADFDIKNLECDRSNNETILYRLFLDKPFFSKYGNSVTSFVSLQIVASNCLILQKYLKLNVHNDVAAIMKGLYDIQELANQMIWAIEYSKSDELIVRFGQVSSSVSSIADSIYNQLNSISANCGIDCKALFASQYFKSKSIHSELFQIQATFNLQSLAISSLKEKVTAENSTGSLVQLVSKTVPLKDDVQNWFDRIMSSIESAWQRSKVYIGEITEFSNLQTKSSQILETLLKIEKTFSDEANLKDMSSGDLLEPLLDQMDSLLLDLRNLSNATGTSEAFEDYSQIEFAWSHCAAILKAENINGQELLVKNEQLELKLIEQVQDIVKKEDLIGQYSVSIELLESKVGVLEKFDKVSKSEALFKEAMQALHEDFTFSETENEKLREHCRKLENRMAVGSPIRNVTNSDRSINIHSIESTNADQIEIQRTCIRFLMMENARLKGLEYSSIALDLFHPSDPLTKRAQLEVGSNPIKDEKIQKMQDLNRLARKLTTEAYMFGAGSSVVDLTCTVGKTNEWKPQGLNPQFQWISQKKKLEEMFENIQKISDEVQKFRHSSVLQNPLSRKLFSLGLVEIPSKLRKSKSIVKVNSRSQFQSIHSLLAK